MVVPCSSFSTIMISFFMLLFPTEYMYALYIIETCEQVRMRRDGLHFKIFFPSVFPLFEIMVDESRDGKRSDVILTKTVLFYFISL